MWQIQFHICVQKLHSHNSERIIKIDPRLTKLCQKQKGSLQFFDSQCIVAPSGSAEKKQFYGSMGCSPGTNWLDFGTDPDLDPLLDTGSSTFFNFLTWRVASEQYYSKRCGPIFMKFLGWVSLGTRNQRLHFDTDPITDLDPWSIFPLFQFQVQHGKIKIIFDIEQY